MTPQQAAQTIAFLNENWSQKPLGKATAAIWLRELSRFDFSDVGRVLAELARTSEWRPSLAEILEPLVLGSKQETEGEAFAKVWAEMTRVGHTGKPDISERARAAVRRLGGWTVICTTWSHEHVAFHRRDFEEAYRDLAERENNEAIRQGKPLESTSPTLVIEGEVASVELDIDDGEHDFRDFGGFAEKLADMKRVDQR